MIKSANGPEIHEAAQEIANRKYLLPTSRRWLPDRAIVVVADNTYAVLELLAFCIGLTSPVTMITRLRLDAAHKWSQCDRSEDANVEDHRRPAQL